MLRLYKLDRTLGGFIHLQADFISSPPNGAIPKILRVGFRRGTNLGGEQYARPKNPNLQVQFRSGPFTAIPCRARSKTDPLGGLHNKIESDT